MGYVTNNSLFLGDAENLKPAKVPILGKILSFTWSPDRKYNYFALKTELNAITRKILENVNIGELDTFDLKIYKLNMLRMKYKYVLQFYVLICDI